MSLVNDVLSATLKTAKQVSAALMERPLRRPDGDYVGKLHPYRRMMFYLMPRRNDSVVYFDDYVKADALLAYLEKARQKLGIEVDVTHLLVAGAAAGFFHQPKMNQFVVGKRLYRRPYNAVTFSMKRKRKDKDAKLSAVKMRFDDPSESFESICKRINSFIEVERTDSRTYADKELDFMGLLPRPVLSGALGVVNWLDAQNLLPKAFIENDPFYTSLFIANLGSVGMRPGYHHLYEYGTCSLFLMVGKIEDRPVCKDGPNGPVVVAEKTLHLRWTYDERIDDGLTSSYGMAELRERLENPEKFFGSFEDAPAAEKPARKGKAKLEAV